MSDSRDGRAPKFVFREDSSDKKHLSMYFADLTDFSGLSLKRQTKAPEVIDVIPSLDEDEPVIDR